MTNPKNLAWTLRLSMFLVLGSLSVAACSPLDADVINETVDINDRFSGLRVEIAGDVTLERAASANRQASADVTATREDADALTFEVVDSVLTIGARESDWRWSHEPVRITLYYESLDRLTVAGSGDINASSLAIEALSLDVLGSGDIEIDNIDADSVRARVAGSGDIDLTGKTIEFRASVVGSGDIDASSLSAQKAVASVAGSGDIAVQASAHLDANIVGSGDIRYSGSPEVSERIAGSGDVMPAS